MSSIRETFKNPWLKLAALCLGVILLIAAIYYLSSIISTVLLAFIFAYIFNPVVNAMARRRVPRTLAVLILIVAALVFVTGITFVLVLDIQTAFSTLLASYRPEGQQPAETPSAGEHQPQERREPSQPEGKQGLAPMSREYVLKGIDSLVRYLPERYRPFATELLTRLYDYVMSRLEEIASSATSFISQVVKSTVSVVVWLFQVLLFFVLTMYLLKDMEKLKEDVRRKLPARYKLDILRIARKIDDDLKHFFQGQLLVAGGLMVSYYIGFLIAGIPMALPIAVIGGLGNFIPYVGTAIGIALALLASLLVHGVDLHLVWVPVVFAVGQALEAGIFTPKFVGGTVGMNPAVVIFVVLVFGELLGFLGVLFAVPLASIIRVLLGEAIMRMQPAGEIEVAEAPKPIIKKPTKPG